MTPIRVGVIAVTLSLTLAVTMPSEASQGPQQLTGVWKNAAIPMRIVRDKSLGVATIAVVLTPTGKVDKCEWRMPDGKTFSGLRYCGGYKKIRYRPAIDANGVPIFSSLRGSLPWPLNGQERTAHAPDIVISSNLISDNLVEPTMVDVNLIIDESGNIESCDVEAPDGKANIDALACGTAASRLHLSPLVLSSGTKVRSLQVATIEITN